MLKKLKIKFVLINLLLITIVLLVCFLSIYATAKRNIEEESVTALQTFIIIPENTGEKQGVVNKPSENKFEIPYSEDVIINKSSHLSVFCVKADEYENLLSVYEYKETLTADNKELLTKYLKEALKNWNRKENTGILEKYNLRYCVKLSGRNAYISFLDMKQEQESMTALVRGFYLIMFLSWLVVILVSFVLAEISIRPVERAWKQQKQFVADASHELKTPLTVILASTDIMLSDKENVSAEQRKWLECTKTESERMKELLSGMLYLARSEDEVGSVVSSPHVVFNLSELLSESLLGFEIQCFEKGKTLVDEVEDNIFIKGNEAEIKQLVEIFLDNACKYSDDNGKISVSLKSGGNRCILSFVNTGTPIPQKDIPHIFERFYRSSDSRSRDEGGYGLGLSIAKSIADKHGTKISVLSGEKGTEFSVRFIKSTPNIEKI